jgi:hypothetical protein
MLSVRISHLVLWRNLDTQKPCCNLPFSNLSLFRIDVQWNGTNVKEWRDGGAFNSLCSSLIPNPFTLSSLPPPSLTTSTHSPKSLLRSRRKNTLFAYWLWQKGTKLQSCYCHYTTRPSTSLILNRTRCNHTPQSRSLFSWGFPLL